MRWIYLSPHMDDATLSAGGLIYDQTQSGIPVEIWTITSGYPPEAEECSLFAQTTHRNWGFSSTTEAIRARRAEDVNAAGILGAKAVHFDFLDCIYRRGKSGEWLYDSVFIPPHEDDADLPYQIASALSVRLKPDDPARFNSPIQRSEWDDVLVCQLGVGSHVDHVLVRQAAELLGLPLRYVIDVPYIFRRPEELVPKSAGMKENVHAVTEAGLKSWQEAVLAYKSQLSTLGEAMETPEKAAESIRSYWAELGGIRLLELE